MEMGLMEIFVSLFSLFLVSIIALFVGLYVRFRHLEKVYEEAQHGEVEQNEEAYHGDVDVLVVGGGIVGSALAAVLARDGRNVTVIERSMDTPDRLAGEGMMSGGMAAIKELGLSVSWSNVNGFMLSKVFMYPPGGRPYELIYEGGAISAVGGKYVEEIRKVALAEKRCTFIEGTVTALSVNNGAVSGVCYREKGKDEIKSLAAPLTVVANGATSKLRAANIPRQATFCSYNIGLEVPNDGNKAVAIVSTSLGSCFTTLISPQLRRFILNTNKNWTKEEMLSIAHEIPEAFRDLYRRALLSHRVRCSHVYYLPPSMKHVPGLLTLGDAFSIRNSIGAAGMTVGLRDVCTWRDLLRGIPDLYNYDAMFAAENLFAVRRKQYSFVTDLMGYIMRHFFVPSSGGLKTLGRSLGQYVPCIKYDWARMYTGMDTRPQLLVYHLAVVVVRAVCGCLMSSGWLGLPWGLYTAGQALVAASGTIGAHIAAQITSMVVLKA